MPDLHSSRGIPIDYEGHCHNCNVTWSGKNCAQLAKRHARRYKHIVEWSIGYLFDGEKEPNYA